MSIPPTFNNRLDGLAKRCSEELGRNAKFTVEEIIKTYLEKAFELGRICEKGDKDE